MATLRLVTAGEIAGLSFSSNIARTADGGISPLDIDLPAAKTASLTTRTEDDAGMLTCTEGHGFVQADTIDVYWAGGRRYGMTVGVVVDNVVPIEGGDGDALPAALTAITAQVQTVVDVDIVGALLVAIGAQCTQKAVLDLLTNEGEGLLIDLVAGELWFWCDAPVRPVIENPLYGKTIISATVSQGSTTPARARFGLLYDSTS